MWKTQHWLFSWGYTGISLSGFTKEKKSQKIIC